MTELVPLTTAHLDALIADPAPLARPWLAARRLALPAGPGFALLAADGAVLAAGGLAPVFDGVAQAWAILSPRAVAAHGRAVTRCALRRLPDLAQTMGLRRVQCVVDMRHARALAWAERLGFRREGRLRAYGPDGADHWMLGRVG